VQEQFGVVHISTGQLLRNAAAQDTPLGRAVKPYTDTGRLAPDELVIAVMEDRITQPDCAEGFILDGFPRTVAQAEALTEMLDNKGVTAPRVIELAVSDEEAVRRINSRGQTSGRADDNEVVARERLDIYHQETEPILAYYRGRQHVHVINGEGTIEEVSEIFVQLFETP
jgi:adenylate kinase